MKTKPKKEKEGVLSFFSVQVFVCTITENSVPFLMYFDVKVNTRVTLFKMI